MTKHFQNTESNNYYRMWLKSNNEYIVFQQLTKQYFDGLWELERYEKKLGTFISEENAMKAMI